MSHQLKLNCQICKYPRLTNLSRHLTTVHGINGQERKCLLAKARFQFYLDNKIIFNHLYQKQILYLHSLVTVFQKHSHYLSKRNCQTQYHPTLHQMRMKTSKFHVLMIVASVIREFGALMFLLWTTISSNCTIPSAC